MPSFPLLKFDRFYSADYRETLTGERPALADDSSSQVVATIELALREIAMQGQVEGPRRVGKNKRKKGALNSDLDRLREYGLGPGAVFCE